MKVNVTVPELAESVTEAIVGEWIKKPGDIVEEGEQLVDIETDKVILEITAPESGELISISKHKNEQVQSNEVIAIVNTSAKKNNSTSKDDVAKAQAIKNTNENKLSNVTELTIPDKDAKDDVSQTTQETNKKITTAKTSPAVRKFANENNINLGEVKGSGKDGRITKQDLKEYIDESGDSYVDELDGATEIFNAPQISLSEATREDRRVPMSGLRKSIAKRLVNAQQEMAMLTTFNEVNMKNIMDLRQRYKESFEEAHGVKLGFMSFFVKAAVEALKEFPIINSSVESSDIVYHDYFDIGIAVSTQRGLIVPVLRNADDLSFAGIEKNISDFAIRAYENKITIEELTGGTFTITNGGVFGSMMSTPIINSPQSAILGMHSIQARPIASNGQVIIAPMMYIALSYDHRIIDGKEAVQFLVQIKNIIEDPNRLLLQV